MRYVDSQIAFALVVLCTFEHAQGYFTSRLLVHGNAARGFAVTISVRQQHQQCGRF